MNAIFYVLVIVLALALVFWIDKKQAKILSGINSQIANDPNFFTDPAKRQLAETTLKTLAYAGPFTIIEARKIKKALGK